MSDELLTTSIDARAAAQLAEQDLEFDVIPSADERFGGWFQAMVRGFLEPGATDDSVEDRRAAFAERRISGVWDGSLADASTPVATASSWIMDLTVPGRRTVPSWAISSITVAPTHRRRGIARNLVEAELRTAAKLGVPVAILTASEATIYERFGFAPAAMAANWTIDTTRATWTGRTPAGRVQLVTTEQGRDEGGFEILQRAMLRAPGQVGFRGLHWARLFGLKGSPDPAALRVVRYDDEAGIQQGLAIYKPVPKDHNATVELHYLMAATDDAYAALWRYLIELDLVTEISAFLRSVDEPLRWQISDSRAAREDHVGDHLWVRILDVAAALEARHYESPGSFVLELTDPLGMADGRYLLSIDDSGAGRVRRLDETERPDSDHHLQLSVNELAAAYLGGTPFGTLASAGRVLEKTVGAADAADAAFRSTVAPWLSVWF